MNHSVEVDMRTVIYLIISECSLLLCWFNGFYLLLISLYSSKYCLQYFFILFIYFIYLFFIVYWVKEIPLNSFYLFPSDINIDCLRRIDPACAHLLRWRSAYEIQPVELHRPTDLKICVSQFSEKGHWSNRWASSSFAIPRVSWLHWIYWKMRPLLWW